MNSRQKEGSRGGTSALEEFAHHGPTDPGTSRRHVRAEMADSWEEIRSDR